MNNDIKSLTRDEIAARIKEWGEHAYRVEQLLNWLYANRATSWDTMSNLPKKLRQRLAEHCTLQTLALVRHQGAADSTQKFLWRLDDQALIESVLVSASPALYGEPSDRLTLCVSTQVGCAYGCAFCASGLDGWKRHLEPHEIVEQVLAVERWHAQHSPESKVESPKSADVHPSPLAPHPAPLFRRPSAAPRFISNLVLMGMGEPLANYDHVLKAVRLLNAPWGGNIGARSITLSTSGLVPQIRQLADEPLQLRLAVSLHGATDEVRARLMPINRKHPLSELIAACDYYQSRKGRLITFEYVLIAGVNDALAQAGALAEHALRLHAKVNVIPYNRVEGLSWQRPSEAAQDAFLAALTRAGVKATLRREKGLEIDAACGQLRLKTERELAAARQGGGEG